MLYLFFAAIVNGNSFLFSSKQHPCTGWSLVTLKLLQIQLLMFLTLLLTLQLAITGLTSTHTQACIVLVLKFCAKLFIG